MLQPAIPDFSRYIVPQARGSRIYLMIEGMSCASCAWQIENELNINGNVKARMNFSTKRLSLEWVGEEKRVYDLLPQIQKLGFRFMPYDVRQLESKDAEEQKFLLKCMAVAGFAAGNIMLLSFALWFTDPLSMGQATRSLLHWLSALVALPAVIYAGQPFFISAFRALSEKRANMDVPISIAIILASGMSLFETIRGGTYVYFDSAITLVFLLLIGRYLDKKARGHARVAAQDLLRLTQGTATVKEADGNKLMLSRDLAAGMMVMVAAGERIAADGVVVSGKNHVVVFRLVVHRSSVDGAGDAVVAALAFGAGGVAGRYLRRTAFFHFRFPRTFRKTRQYGCADFDCDHSGLRYEFI